MFNQINKLLFIAVLSFTPLVAFSFPFFSVPVTVETDEEESAPTQLVASVIVFSTSSTALNGLSPLTFNFHKDKTNPKTGEICLSGKIAATRYDGKEVGTAVYDLLSNDGANKGLCYSNVTRTCAAPQNPTTVGNGTAEVCTYESPALTAKGVADADKDDATNEGNITEAQIVAFAEASVNGRFKVDINEPLTGTYTYLLCLDEATAPPYCDFAVGLGFNSSVPQTFSPEAKTRNGVTVDANVVMHAQELCVNFDAGDLGLVQTDAVKSKFTDGFRVCEGLAIKLVWCSDITNDGVSPSCVDPNSEGDLPIGGMNSVLGSTLANIEVERACVSTVQDLQALPGCPDLVSLKSCSDSSTGYITFPADYLAATCTVADGEDDDGLPKTKIINTGEFTYSSAQNGAPNIVNIKTMGATWDSPGYIGDNTLPTILPYWTAIVSTPDNQPNKWDFTNDRLSKVAYIHGRNGDDEIWGSLGGDIILGGSNDDTLRGNQGDDFLQGGDGVDTLYGEAGNDLLIGYECNGDNATCVSYSNKGSEDDTLEGGIGDDCLDGGRGNDTLKGGDGNDAYIVYGQADNDTITDFSLSDDQIVNLSGNVATVNWVTVSKEDVCRVTTGSKSNILLANVSEDSCVKGYGENQVTIVAGKSSMPVQCSRHPGAL